MIQQQQQPQLTFQGFKPSGMQKIATSMGFQGEEKELCESRSERNEMLVRRVATAVENY